MSTSFSATRSKRAAMWLLVAALAGITGAVSYLHALYVCRWLGNTEPVVYMLPLVADLMIVTASVTLIEAKRLDNSRPWQAMASLGTGVVVTVVMNVAAGLRLGDGTMLLNALIPVAFILSLESLIVLLGKWRNAPLNDEPAATCGHTMPLTLDEALTGAAPFLSKRALADAFEVSRPRVDRALPPVSKVAAGTPSDPSTNGSNPDD
jgi:hypothetical protein